MKLILSRKGFDSAAGGCANAIMPDETLLPLPIPDKRSPIRYEQVTTWGYPVGRIVMNLTRGKQKPHYGAHLDPDLLSSSYPRISGWRPLFGQTDSAQSTLAGHGVGAGDLFLFFGWFRNIEEYAGEFRFVKGAPDLHVLWGWLQVDHVLTVATGHMPAWAADHPHVASPDHGTRNTLYISRDTLVIDGASTRLPGAGLFKTYDERLRLTKAGANRSVWSLPSWFAPTDGRLPLGYHSDVARWSRDGDRTELRSVGRGQEFVLDTRQYPESPGWVRDLIALDQ